MQCCKLANVMRKTHSLIWLSSCATVALCQRRQGARSCHSDRRQDSDGPHRKHRSANGDGRGDTYCARNYALCIYSHRRRHLHFVAVLLHFSDPWLLLDRCAHLSRRTHRGLRSRRTSADDNGKNSSSCWCGCCRTANWDTERRQATKSNFSPCVTRCLGDNPVLWRWVS